MGPWRGGPGLLPGPVLHAPPQSAPFGCVPPVGFLRTHQLSRHAPLLPRCRYPREDPSSSAANSCQSIWLGSFTAVFSIDGPTPKNWLGPALSPLLLVGLPQAMAGSVG